MESSRLFSGFEARPCFVFGSHIGHFYAGFGQVLLSLVNRPFDGFLGSGAAGQRQYQVGATSSFYCVSSMFDVLKSAQQRQAWRKLESLRLPGALGILCKVGSEHTTDAHLPVYLCTAKYTYTYMNIHTHIYIYTHRDIYVHIFTDMYTYVYMNVYMYTYISITVYMTNQP